MENSELVQFLDKHGNVGFYLLKQSFCNNLDEAENLMDFCYRGEHASLGAFAKELIEVEMDKIELMELRSFIDYEAYALQLVDNGTIGYFEVTLEKTVHVFWLE